MQQCFSLFRLFREVACDMRAALKQKICQIKHTEPKTLDTIDYG